MHFSPVSAERTIHHRRVTTNKPPPYLPPAETVFPLSSLFQPFPIGSCAAAPQMWYMHDSVDVGLCHSLCPSVFWTRWPFKMCSSSLTRDKMLKTMTSFLPFFKAFTLSWPRKKRAITLSLKAWNEVFLSVVIFKITVSHQNIYLRYTRLFECISFLIKFLQSCYFWGYFWLSLVTSVFIR